MSSDPTSGLLRRFLRPSRARAGVRGGTVRRSPVGREGEQRGVVVGASEKGRAHRHPDVGHRAHRHRHRRSAEMLRPLLQSISRCDDLCAQPPDSRRSRAPVLLHRGTLTTNTRWRASRGRCRAAVFCALQDAGDCGSTAGSKRAADRGSAISTRPRPSPQTGGSPGAPVSNTQASAAGVEDSLPFRGECSEVAVVDTAVDRRGSRSAGLGRSGQGHGARQRVLGSSSSRAVPTCPAGALGPSASP